MGSRRRGKLREFYGRLKAARRAKWERSVFHETSICPMCGEFGLLYSKEGRMVKVRCGRCGFEAEVELPHDFHGITPVVRLHVYAELIDRCSGGEVP